MKTCLVWLFLLCGALVCAPSTRASEVRADNAVITALHVDDKGLHASFDGRWATTDTRLVLADVDKNGFIVIRDAEMNPEEWQSLCDTLQEALTRHVPVSVTFNDWGGSHSGILIFRAPPCQVRAVLCAPPKASVQP